MSAFWKSAGFRKWLGLFVASVILFVIYLHLYVFVFKWELPKTVALKRENAELKTRANLLRHEMERFEEDLNSIQMRDEDIYRSIFGLNSISSDVREAGFSDNYGYLDETDRSGEASGLCATADGLIYKAYIQSRSFDEIELMLIHADNMSSCIPAIYPILPDRDVFRISSPYGYRIHPLLHYRRMHRGIDFSLPKGSGVYATGDGEVEDVKIENRGYGRQILINHGFGYKTRYAHLNKMYVAPGMKVKRGELIGTVGNTGLSSGSHLHYEVLYKGKNVNPYNYFDRDISLEQYKDIVGQVSKDELNEYVLPMHRKALKSGGKGKKKSEGKGKAK